MAGTRQTFQALITALATQLPDNNVGQITPQILRDFLESMLRTCFVPDALLFGVTPTAANLTAAWSIVPNAVWTTSSVDNSGDLTVDQANGKLIGSAIAGYDYLIYPNVTLEGAINTVIEVGIFKNGVAPAVALGAVNLAGAGRPISTFFTQLFLVAAASDFYQLGLRAPGGAVTITVDVARIRLQLKNTWD